MFGHVLIPALLRHPCAAGLSTSLAAGATHKTSEVKGTLRQVRGLTESTQWWVLQH